LYVLVGALSVLLETVRVLAGASSDFEAV
jgi:hypothetical protein